MSRAAAAMLALGLVAASPAAGWASGLEVRIGGFFPRAESNRCAPGSNDCSIFTDDAELYTVSRRDWRGVYGGVEYSFNLVPHLEMGISIDGYGKTVPTVYRDFTRPGGEEIRQNLKLTIVPLGLSLRVLPLDRYAAIQPYATIGGDVFFYKYEEFGEFIDFFDDSLPISADSFESDGAAFGGHAAAGLRVPIGHDFAITGEVRYQFAQKKRMNDDFSLNRIDLNGASATLGVRLRF
jgi:Outer membrane protein beta-barrel domain